MQAAAVRFEDQAGYNATVLDGARLTHPMALFAAGPTSVTVTDVLTGLGSVSGALIMAWLALYWRRLPLLRGYRPNASFAAADEVFWVQASVEAAVAGIASSRRRHFWRRLAVRTARPGRAAL